MPCFHSCHSKIASRAWGLAVVLTFSIWWPCVAPDPLQDVLERLGGFAEKRGGPEADALREAAALLGSIGARRQEAKEKPAEPEINFDFGGADEIKVENVDEESPFRMPEDLEKEFEEFKDRQKPRASRKVFEEPESPPKRERRSRFEDIDQLLKDLESPPKREGRGRFDHLFEEPESPPKREERSRSESLFEEPESPPKRERRSRFEDIEKLLEDLESPPKRKGRSSFDHLFEEPESPPKHEGRSRFDHLFEEPESPPKREERSRSERLFEQPESPPKRERRSRLEDVEKVLKDLEGGRGRFDHLFEEPESPPKHEGRGRSESSFEEPESPPKREERAKFDDKRAKFEDPFADMLSGFISGTEKLKEDRDKKREELKKAEAEFKESKTEVADLERKLREAQAKMKRLEVEVQAKKEAKHEAERAVTRAYTNIAGDVARTAEEAMGKMGGSRDGEGDEKRSATSRVEPRPYAQATIWGNRNYEGDSHKLKCCDYYDLSNLMKPAFVRSITLPEGVRATLYPTRNKYLDDGDSKLPSVDIFGSLAEVDSIIPYRQSCCQAIQLLPGISHHEDTSVVLYEKPDFEGKTQAFLPGDHELRRPMKVSSIRVPAGLKVTLYAAPKFKDGSWITFLIHDTRNFPREETSISETDRPNLPVFSLKVREMKGDDLNGVYLYHEPNFRGRPQFFGSGEHYIYPESWPEVKSAKPTPKTFAQLFTSKGLLSVHSEMSSIDASQTRPHTLQVNAICDPPDYCGEHGKCVAPQKCMCNGAYQGQRCNLQNPDETSAVLCERNAVVLGETLGCALHARRYNQGCNSSSLFLKLKPSDELKDAATFFGSPLVLERHLGGPPQDLAVFPFDVTFNKTGSFAEPFVFEIFGRDQDGVFVPQIHVLERCDLKGTRAHVSCKQEDDDASCSLVLKSEGAVLRCPAQAVTVLLLHDDRPADTLPLVDSGEAIAETFNFTVNQVQAAGVVRLAVEIRHSPPWQAATLRLETEAKVRTAPATSLASAKFFLRNKQFHQALKVLEGCLPARPCTSLYATALLQLGRFDDMEPVLQQLGSDGALLRQRMEKGQLSIAAAEGALPADPATAMEHLRRAIEIAPLVPKLRVQRSQAALLTGDFNTALEEARQAQHLTSITAGVTGRELEDCAVLLAFGGAVLAFGHGDVARQNFNACIRLEDTADAATSPSVAKGKELADATHELQREALELKGLLAEERWANAVDTADKFLAKHGQVWPVFKQTTWGLEATMALCISRHVLNNTDTASVLETCQLVVEAPSNMRDRLDDQALLKCQVALAEIYEREQKLKEALAATEAAEAMLGDNSLDDMAAILQIMRERLQRAERENAEKNKKNETADKPKREAPTDMYAVLGIPKNATAADIKKAYRNLALKYHPDKNKDPEAVQIFLDVQKAYQILSDPELRRKYDAGHQNVDEEADAKNMKPMKFRVVETDRERGIAKVWWYDPNTGEEGFMEMEIDKEEPESKKFRARELYEHCCLPEPETK